MPDLQAFLEKLLAWATEKPSDGDVAGTAAAGIRDDSDVSNKK